MQASVKQNKAVKPIFKRKEAKAAITNPQNTYQSKTTILETVDKKENLESHFPKIITKRGIEKWWRRNEGLIKTIAKCAKHSSWGLHAYTLT